MIWSWFKATFLCGLLHKTVPLEQDSPWAREGYVVCRICLSEFEIKDFLN